MDRDWLLWAGDGRLPPIYQWLGRIFPRYMKAAQGDQAVYVSHLDGSDMRRLFTAHRSNANSGRHGPSTYNLMSDIRWLPDSKRISFVYKNALYIAPVD